MTPAPAEGPCPCGLAGSFGVRSYAACCGQYLDGGVPAPDASSLMRSRYTAHVRSRADYLLKTWDAAHRPDRLDLDPELTWLDLTVVDHRAQGDRAQVEFVARYRVAGQRTVQTLDERSHFVRRQGRWYYLHG